MNRRQCRTAVVRATLVAVMGIAGCGVPLDEQPVALAPTPNPSVAPTEDASTDTVRATVYLIDGEGLLRPVGVDVGTEGIVANVVAALATAEGADEGLGTSVDSSTMVINGIPEVDEDGVLSVNITPPTTGETEAQIEAFAQLVYTLTALEGVEAVDFTIDGEVRPIPRELPGEDPTQRSLSRADYPCFDPFSLDPFCDR